MLDKYKPTNSINLSFDSFGEYKIPKNSLNYSSYFVHSNYQNSTNSLGENRILVSKKQVVRYVKKNYSVLIRVLSKE